MSHHETVLVQSVDLPVDLPTGFSGAYERQIHVRTGDSHTVLNVFAENREGRQCYVRSLHGPSVEDCDDQFLWWLCGFYDSAMGSVSDS